jgi:hypothetical protein
VSSSSLFVSRILLYLARLRLPRFQRLILLFEISWASQRLSAQLSPGFYEAEFVKTRRENSFLFIFCSFLAGVGNNSPLWLWCLIAAGRRLRPAVIKLQSQLPFERAT